MAKGKADLPGKPIAVYLIKSTDKGRGVKPAERQRDQMRVQKALIAAGANCELYRTPGGLYDHVAILRDVDLHSAVMFASIMEEGGLVTATLVPGYHIFK